MKTLFCKMGISVALLCSMQQSAPAQIEFEKGPWAEIIAKGKVSNKMIFVDMYAVWCGPCKAMVRNVFSQKPVYDHFNAKYVNAEINAEKGEGTDLAKKYDVASFPTYLFIDGNGKLVYKIEGALAADKFLESAKKADEKFSSP